MAGILKSYSTYPQDQQQLVLGKTKLGAGGVRGSGRGACFLHGLRCCAQVLHYAAVAIALWIIAVTAWLLAIVAISGVVYVLRRAEPAQVRALQSSVRQCADDIDDLFERFTRQNAKLARRESRANAKQDPGDTAQRPGESVAEWKARMRVKIRNGEIQHV